jgi:uncharacterized protein (DUF983 family)
MSTTETTQRGFANICPACDEEDGLEVRLADVLTITCTSCSNEFTAEKLRKSAAQIAVILDWLETAPEYGKGEGA